MRVLIPAVFASAAAGCGASSAPVAEPTCPEPVAPECPEPAPAVDSNILTTEPAADAPAELAQYGRLVGTWRCQAQQHQEDGSWKDSTTSTWTFFYALGGRAIQDVWVPDGDGAVGTNLRVYDPEARTWSMVWASASQSFFDEFTAKAEGDDIVMHGERRKREMFNAHRARITFHDIGDDSFAWRYEATSAGADGPWQPIMRIQCARAGEPDERGSL